MPTIEFRTYDEYSHEFFRPVAAKEVTPEWWKKMKIRVDHRGRVSQTIKSCPSMLDWLTMGYYIIATVDIPIRNGYSWKWPDGDSRFTVSDCENFSHSHPASQLVDSISYDGEDGIVNDAFKITNFWNIKTPPGYSVLFLDPFLFTNKYFACWQGVIDTDGFNVNLDNAQCIFYPKVDHSFVIEAGTPLVQVFPFKREEWAATYFLSSGKDFLEKNAIDDMSMQKWQRRRGLRELDGSANDKLNIGGYRNAKIWQPKSKLFDKPKEQEPPPECPMHKKDFKDKQRELTDLNWDGSESKKIDRE
tara:strand:+ start:5147 stop:6055 length:909 start_codon:yes stop_codon:yes gene_type:complete